MILCDLCGQPKECQPKEIEGREYDICSECWNPLAEKLKGKGRAKKEQEMVFLPPVPLSQNVKSRSPCRESRRRFGAAWTFYTERKNVHL